MRIPALAAALVVAAGSTAFACIWDDDTLRTEVEGLPAVAQVIAGSFERNPALYYEMKTAASEIRRAIELKPDAHFGRERYQLKAMDWLIAGKPFTAKDERGYRQGLGDFLGLASKHLTDTRSTGKLKELGVEDAASGLAGMIALGGAWESVDVFHSLQLALQADGRSSVAFLARLRVEELIDAGRGSLQPDAPTGADLLKAIPPIYTLRKEIQADLRKTYAKARKKSSAWQERRTKFMVERLNAGRHPDWDETFWDGFGG